MKGWFSQAVRCKPGVYRMEPLPHVICIVPDGGKHNYDHPALREIQAEFIKRSEIVV